MTENIKKYIEKLESWFLWFWIKKYRMSFLLIFLITIGWLYSAFIIPKESTPDINFGIITINTIYQWASPEDIDDLITTKIEKEIEDIEWINKYSSTSSVGISSIVIELETDTDTINALTEVKDAVDKASIPIDAEDPFVSEISWPMWSNIMFQLILYADKDKFSKQYLKEKALLIRSKLEGEWSINNISIDNNEDEEFEYEVLIEKTKLEQIWLQIMDVSNIISSFNKNQPLWNYKIWDLKYDFRIDWEVKSVQELWEILIKYDYETNSSIKLKDIAEINKVLIDDKISHVWFNKSSWYNSVVLTFEKETWSNIITSSKKAKEEIDKLFKWYEFEEIWFVYTNDLSEVLWEDYSQLVRNALWSLILVFIVLWIFVWIKEALIASLVLPLAFLITFIVLNKLWLTLNFLTNFSLVISFGIAIDTIIVIVEWASEKMKYWFSPRHAIILSIREYKRPLIAWTSTSLFAFLPLLSLPGILWKFMSYIPITIFITLLAWLVLSLTLVAPIFFKLSRNKKKFEENKDFQKYWLKENVELLAYDRIGKKEIGHDQLWIRDKFLNNLIKRHKWFLEISLKNRSSRIWTFIAPFIILILSIVIISPRLWFTLFESSDEWVFQISIKWQEWVDTEYMENYLWWIENSLSEIDMPELENYQIITNWNKINLTIDLLDEKIRKNQWLRAVWEIEELILDKLSYLKSYWLKVNSEVESNWPPSGGAIWISLVANSNQDFQKLIEISKDFESFLKNKKWTKNITNSSQESPWQFVFQFDNEKLKYLWLTPNYIMWELYMKLNWTKSWSLKWRFEDSEIRIKIKDFEDELTPENILNLSINTPSWLIKLWEVLEYNFQTAVSTINREDGKILVKIESDVEKWINPWTINTELVSFANEYNFPSWISWQRWWEVEENKELIISIIISFIIAIILIFMVLVLQFNSYVQPIMILSSILFSVIWMNIWLFITWHMYSLSAVIGFIALTWIVVNDAIILIDRINNNIYRWMWWKDAIIEASKSRLQPIIVTTLTTSFGVLPISLTDTFFGWLWYTLMFGLFVGSLATLTIIPTFYYMLFVKEK